MVSPIRKALETAKRSALHFEARDVYTPDDPDYLGWVAGERFDPAVRYREWCGRWPCSAPQPGR